MATKAMICIDGGEVSPRFDLTREVVIATVSDSGKVQEERELVLPNVSVEILFNILLTEGIQVVICGGIDEECYQYLAWKKIRVMDSVIGEWKEALKRLARGRLEAGDIL